MSSYSIEGAELAAEGLGHKLTAWTKRETYHVAWCERCGQAAFSPHGAGANPALEEACHPTRRAPVRADPESRLPPPDVKPVELAEQLFFLAPIAEVEAGIQLGITWRQVRGLVLRSRGVLRMRGHTVVRA